MQNSNKDKTTTKIIENLKHVDIKPINVLYEDFHKEKYLKNIINNIGDPFFIKDDESRIILVNDAFCNLFDLERENIIGNTLAEEVSPDERDWFLRIDKQVLETGEENITEESLTVRNNKTKTISTRKTRYIDENNNKYLVGVIRDISDRKKAEEQLKETLSQNKLAVDIAELGVWQLNVDSGELLWNDRHLEFYGITRDEFNNNLEGWSKQLHPEDKEYAENSFNKVFEKETIHDVNFRIIRPNGEIRFLSASASPILINNKLVKIIGVNRDITDRKKSEKQLEETLIQLTKLKQQIEAENIYLKEELKLEKGFDDIIGSDKSLKKVLKQVERVANTDTTVLIMGETGTGKELIAKAIHSKSDRKDKPMVKVNCSAIPKELIESEFFGHEAGAFTTAIKRKIGRFELANGGTIFLDEIGDLSLSLQTRLLRVLQEMEFERVGGEITIKVDVRVITATNRKLKEEVEKGNFRQDLYYRLNVFPITCPPLRQRTSDIPALVNHFINKYGAKINKQIKTVHQNSLDRLKRYYWPGNVRELEHVIERAVILNNSNQLRLGGWFMDSSNNSQVADGFTTLETVERDHIIKVLEETNWRIRGNNGASEILGLKPTTLESRIKKMNIVR